MKNTVLLAMFVLMAGCASTESKESAVARNDAIEDYVASAELKEIDAIRTRGAVSHTEVNDKHIVIRDQRKAYLATFRQRCRGLRDEMLEPDIRQDANRIRARFDTYRGCRIDQIFEISEGQATELIDLGKKSRNK